jgi:hypothetical protein
MDALRGERLVSAESHPAVAQLVGKQPSPQALRKPMENCSWLSFNGCLGFLSEFPGVQQGSWIANGLATGYKLNVLTSKLQGPVLKTDLARPPVLQPYSTKAYVHNHI